MTSINISLKEEAYQRLVQLKRSDESFSDEILRITKRSTGADLMECFGSMKGISKKSEDEFEDGVKKARLRMSSTLNKSE